MVIFENMIKYNSFHLLFLNKIPQPLPPKSTVITTVKLPIQDGHHGFLLFTGIWLFENRHNSLSLRVVPITQFLVSGSWTIEVRTATYEPEIDQSQHAKSVSHIIKNLYCALRPLRFKHGASLYLKFEGLNLSVVIIFKTFHWLKNSESCSVVSVARRQCCSASEK